MKHHPLQIQGLITIVFLVIQYLLGMFTNLFVIFPDNEKGGELWLFAWHQLPLALQIIIGISLLISSIVLIIRSIRHQNHNWLIASSVGSLAILAAILGGSTFIPTQTDAYSYLMAVSFIIAILAFGWGVYKDK